ncbi:MAG: hypothetical protein RLZZ450_5726 [Pseudomonadota bacterium]
MGIVRLGIGAAIAATFALSSHGCVDEVRPARHTLPEARALGATESLRDTPKRSEVGSPSAAMSAQTIYLDPNGAITTPPPGVTVVLSGNANSVPLQQISGPAGSTTIRLNGQFQQAVHAELKADGSLAAGCETTAIGGAP